MLHDCSLQTEALPKGIEGGLNWKARRRGFSPQKLEAGLSVMGVEGFPKPTARWTLNRV